MTYTFPRKALGQDKIAHVDIRVAHMSYADAVEWHALIQPTIRQIDGKAEDGVPPRADHSWDWPAMRQLFPLYMVAQGFRCQPFCIRTPTVHGKMALAGMVLVIDNYPYPRGAVVRQQPESAFVWFLTAAPAERLKALGVADPPRMGIPLVDVGVTTSFAMDHQGRTWLHAAPEGGDGLLDLYGNPKKCGMEVIPPAQVIAGRRKPDGRFFRMDETAALGFIAKTAGFR